MTLSSMDYWRLADELSVVDAAILITGNDPSTKHGRYDGDEEYWVQSTDYEGFEATFKALRNAILSNRLPAILAFNARQKSDYSHENYDYATEQKIEFDLLIKAQDYNVRLLSNKQLDQLGLASTVFVIKEPNWSETTIAVDSLKEWLSSKGLAPDFFFPKGRPEGFRDKSHPRYSPKLACAVAAWESVQKPGRNASVKATVAEWVRTNAVLFDMIGSEGVPTNKAVEEVCSVVNWQTSGGAVPTACAIEDEEEIEDRDIQNYQDLTQRLKDRDSEIPF